MEKPIAMASRERAAALRRAPGNPVHLVAGHYGNGALGDVSRTPTTITLFTTNDAGEPANWFNDVWWTDLIQVWGAEPLTLQIAPTPGAITNPVVLYFVEMVRRVVPRWRTLGFSFADGDWPESVIQQLARSFFDELRFIDSTGGVSANRPVGGAVRSAAELIGAIRFEQARFGVTQPALVRLPESVAALFVDPTVIAPNASRVIRP